MPFVDPKNIEWQQIGIIVIKDLITRLPAGQLAEEMTNNMNVSNAVIDVVTELF